MQIDNDIMMDELKNIGFKWYLWMNFIKYGLKMDVRVFFIHEWQIVKCDKF